MNKKIRQKKTLDALEEIQKIAKESGITEEEILESLEVIRKDIYNERYRKSEVKK